MPQDRVPIPGSARSEADQEKATGAPDPDECLEVTVRLRERPGARSMPSADELGMKMPKERDYISREEFAEQQGADPADVSAVTEYARAHGLRVEQTDLASRSIVMSGPVQALEDAFGVKLARYASPDDTYIAYHGPLHLPPDLVPVVQGVFGLDTSRRARPS